MATLILILFALALFHFIYEGIVAPSMRMGMRYTLFGLRDELREEKLEHDSEVDDYVYEAIEGGLNGSIKHLSHIDLAFAYKAVRTMEDDAELKEHAEKMDRLLSACGIESIRRIRSEGAKMVSRALLVNVGAWGLYLTPVALAVLAYSGITAAIKKVFSLPEDDINKIIPTGGYASV